MNYGVVLPNGNACLCYSDCKKLSADPTGAGKDIGSPLRRLTIIMALITGGCAQEPPPPPQVWGRVDCQRASGNPELQLEFERSRTVCLGRAEAAAVAGTSGIQPGYGIGGAIASGIARGVAQDQIQTATALSCMAEHGYLMRTQAEHDANCAAINAQKAAASKAALKQGRKPSK